MLPRELLAEPAIPGLAAPVSTPSVAAPDRAAVAQLAERIANATLPVIVCTASGADRETVAPLVALCERHGIGYVEEQARYLNFPAGHPLHLGYQLAPVFTAADVVCFIECDVPWLPGGTRPNPDAFIAHAGIDPAFSRYPIRSHRADLTITSGAAAFIAALDEALTARRSATDRVERIQVLATRLRGNPAAASPSNAPITRDAVATALAAMLDADAIIFNEYWAPPALLARTRPQTYFYLSSAGGLGWALPAALDGATRSVYPNGTWRAQRGPSLSDLTPMPTLEKYIEASGAFGERVATPAELGPALRRALHAVQVERRQALINVIGS
jgi:acetolactate synthase I/II/III large subunit